MTISQSVLIRLIRLYQLTLSLLVGFHCRFEPSCSEYMRQAIIEHGTIKGIILGSKRLLRCHPWGGHGYDPVVPLPPSGRNQSPNTDNR